MQDRDPEFSESTLTLRAPIGPRTDFSTLDPAKIVYQQQYLLLKQLTSTLVELDDQYRIVPSMAEEFMWADGSLRLKIRDGHRTISGDEFSAKDVYLTLKRQIILKSNSHGSLHEFLCPDDNITSLDQVCPGLAVDGQYIVLTPKKYHGFLLKLLASRDFGILHHSQIDQKTLKIKHYKETSGPFSLEVKGRQEAFVQNPYHWQSHQAGPARVELVRLTDSDDPVEMFSQGKLTLLPSGANFDRNRYFNAAEQHPQIVLRRSRNIGLLLLVFTERGIAELSVKERFSFGKLMRSRFSSYAAATDYGGKITYQFLAELGEGRLGPAELEKVKALFLNLPEYEPGKPITISSFSAAYSDFLKKVIGAGGPIDIKENWREYRSGQLSKDDIPHAYIIPTDTAWDESVSLLSYSRAQGILDYQGVDKDINDFLSAPDKSMRLSLLRSIHLKMLQEGNIVPLITEPYFSLVKAPWRFYANPLQPSTDWHTLRFEL